jgi:hypothetical protein
LVKSRWFKAAQGILFTIVMFMVVGSIAGLHQNLISGMEAEMHRALSVTFILALAAGTAFSQALDSMVGLLDDWFKKPEDDRNDTAPAGGEG